MSQSKIDPFYREASKIIGAYRGKPKGVRIGTPTPVVVTNNDISYELMKCMNCDFDLHVSVGSMRARMLKGWSEIEVEGKVADPTTGLGVIVTRVFPKFTVGRICLKCQKILRPTTAYFNADGKIVASPKRNDEYEILQERITARQQRTITQGMIDMEDEAEAPIKEREEKVYIKPSRRFPTVRVEVHPVEPIDPEDEKLELANETKDGINLKGFRKYGGGSRGGQKNYDREVNFDNIKKKARR